MKRIFTILALSLVLTLTLTSCSMLEDLIGGLLGSENTPAETDVSSGEDNRAVTKMTDAALEALLAQGFEKVSDDEEEAAETERTVEELLQMLADGTPMQDSSGADYSTIPQTFSVDLTEMAQLQGTTVQFSEEPWETDKTVEEFDMEDFTAEMTPEEKAEWDEMMSKTEEDWAAEIAAMEAEMEELTNSMNDFGGDDTYDTGDLGDVEIPDMGDIQQQIEDAMKDIPDEYKDMFGDLGGLGDLGDLEGLLGGLLGGN
ncbi:MAG: hypothetical protein IKC03_00910 [Oscillospiraceae bacterium]|nr:hypothetical protein [Oscillospiraceae bacterium]MBR2894203.1 hypothetical protein [Oscillospiraceae bacterium]